MRPEEDISNWKTNENFIQWMLAVNPGLTREKLLSFTSDKWLGGWCEDFALYFAIRWGVPMLFLNREHDLVKIDGKYYDGTNLNGSSALSRMKYVMESERLSRLSEAQLESLLEVDDEWREYPPLASKVHCIVKSKLMC